MSHHINILTTLKNTNVAFRGKINLREKEKKRLVREKNASLVGTPLCCIRSPEACVAFSCTKEPFRSSVGRMAVFLWCARNLGDLLESSHDFPPPIAVRGKPSVVMKDGLVGSTAMPCCALILCVFLY